MDIHAAVGRRIGLSRQEIDDLLLLDPEKFEHREWLALKYAQDWAFLDGGEPAGSYMEDFDKTYTAEEKQRIVKLLKMIQFANYWNNTFRGRPICPDREGLSVNHCSLSGDKERCDL